MSAGSEATPSRRRLLLQLVVGLAAAWPLYLAIFALPVVPSHDGPRNLYAAHVFCHIDQPGFASDFRASHPVTALGFALLYGLFERFVSWRLAYALAIAIGLSLLPIGLLLITRSFDSKRAPLALLGVAAAYQWASHMGFVNYVASVGLGFLTIGVGLGSIRWSLRRELGVYLLLTATALFHPLGAQMAGLSLLAFRLAHLTRGRIVRELGALFLGASPALLVTLLSGQAMAAYPGSTQVLPLTVGERLENLTRWFLSGPLFRSMGVLTFAAIGLVVATRELARPRGRNGRSIALLALVAVGLIGTSLAPMHSDTWQYLQPRFIPLAVLGAAVLVPIEKLADRVRAALGALLFVYALASNGWIALDMARFMRENRSAFAALGTTHAEPGRTLLPIIALPQIMQSYQRDRGQLIPTAAPLFNLGQLYAVDRAAVTPYTFSKVPNVHLIESKNERMPHVPAQDFGDFFREGADPVRRRNELGRLAWYTSLFDDTLFLGTEPDAVELLSYGYATEVRHAGFFIGRFVGCAGRVTIRGTSLLSGVALVAWTDTDRIAESFPLSPPLPRTFDIERGSCRGLAVRIYAEGEQGSLHCRDAPADGIMTVRSRSPEVVCELEPVPPTATSR